jgi:hypothetical protein
MDEIFRLPSAHRQPAQQTTAAAHVETSARLWLGLLLATQNPVDLDYKALSNTGTWFIGKLQTERDKNRLLDGLESLAGGFSRAEMDKLISSIGKRVFVMNNVHEQNADPLPNPLGDELPRRTDDPHPTRDLNALAGATK